MKKNELTQIKGLDIKELRGKVKVIKDELANLTIDKNMKKSKDTKIISKKRKDLAQILTVIRQKELLNQLETKISEDAKKKEVVMDNSTKKPKAKKGERTELSK